VKLFSGAFLPSTEYNLLHESPATKFSKKGSRAGIGIPSCPLQELPSLVENIVGTTTNHKVVELRDKKPLG
jgi:hypothetical protein